MTDITGALSHADVGKGGARQADEFVGAGNCSQKAQIITENGWRRRTLLRSSAWSGDAITKVPCGPVLANANIHFGRGIYVHSPYARTNLSGHDLSNVGKGGAWLNTR
jgi:hypothetical protein